MRRFVASLVLSAFVLLATAIGALADTWPSGP